MDHDLCAPVGVRFQQHRVEIGVRRQPGRPSLYGLSPPNLSAVGTRGRVIRHVLGFEGRNAQPPPPGDATQTGDDNGLADIGAGPLDHDDLRTHPGCVYHSLRLPSAPAWGDAQVLTVEIIRGVHGRRVTNDDTQG